MDTSLYICKGKFNYWISVTIHYHLAYHLCGTFTYVQVQYRNIPKLFINSLKDILFVWGFTFHSVMLWSEKNIYSIMICMKIVYCCFLKSTMICNPEVSRVLYCALIFDHLNGNIYHWWFETILDQNNVFDICSDCRNLKKVTSFVIHLTMASKDWWYNACRQSDDPRQGICIHAIKIVFNIVYRALFLQRRLCMVYWTPKSYT